MKEAVANDGAQDLNVKQSGGIAKGVSVEDAAVYQPAPATTCEANESDAAPAKPKPEIPPQAVVPPVQTQSLPQIAGKKTVSRRHRGYGPFHSSQRR